MSAALVKRVYIIAYLGKNASSSDTPTTPAITPYIEDLNCGWIGPGNGIWTYESPTLCYLDMYQVEGGHRYWLTLGEDVGTRFRAIFTTVDVSNQSGTVQGVVVNTTGLSNPAPYQNVYYTPETNGYIVIHKDNAGKTGIKTYLYDVTPTLYCWPLFRVNPDTFDSQKALAIVDKIGAILEDSFQVQAVKKVEGYKLIVK